MRKLYKTLDPAVKIAINFLSQRDIIGQASILSYKNMLVKMLEFHTANIRDSDIESGVSGALPLKESQEESLMRESLMKEESEVVVESELKGEESMVKNVE